MILIYDLIAARETFNISIKKSNQNICSLVNFYKKSSIDIIKMNI